ncbi:PD-(D/E)XK nuclease family protein [Desulfovibrio sp. OttesenSCG-928-F20]|nr:PD-(D/E)XK nuclease family protein [Desulfovibrio sp. OttesenSCG-928-M16]MDL2290891.1 PD-(D/E)XK nuclease family protein [Desulfovibrio sp. OttesenSCG-928-F20]
MMTSPILLVPWRKDFLRTLLELALKDTQGRIHQAAFIFPHSRPMRYLSLLLRDAPGLARPLLMPRMLPLAELFSALNSRLLARPARQAGQLDRVALLLRCLREEANDSPFSLDAASFFPWGLKLDSLFEECFIHCRAPENFLHVEDSVSPYAAMLLSRLGALFSRYRQALEEREWTSPGLDAFTAASALAKGQALPPDLFAPSVTSLYIAGFHLLGGAEDRLFKTLWQERGAKIVIHADPALTANTKEAHWSCAAFADWAERWKTRIEELPEAEEPRRAAPVLRFVAGHDLHSQLAVLKEELRQRPCPAPERDMEAAGSTDDANWQSFDEAVLDHRADTAVILPAGELLLPVLHHLPDKNVNISMGYPLASSPLFRLLDTLGTLQQGRKGRAYYWRDLVDFFRHPYIKMLLPGPQDEGDDLLPTDQPADQPADQPDSPALRRLLHRLEQALRDQGRAYADPRTLLATLCQIEDLSPEAGASQAAAFLEDLFSICLDGFEAAQNTRGLGLALERFCALLLEHGPGLWKRFPIDAECLYRLRQSVIPELAGLDFGDEVFTPSSLFAMLRALLKAQRAPFEAEPLVGLQIMGMLESRLLSFRRVIVLDATEERLPGSPAGDPLLPEALRPELGLPSMAGREQAVAHSFFTLLNSADECLLLWSDSADAPGIREMKSGRSRFVQELLWREEKQRGRLFARQGQDGPLQVLGSSITPMITRENGIRITGAVRDLLDDLSKAPLSASLLDTYLCCPVRFFYERLLKLSPTEEVNEGDDPLAVGDLLHQSLEKVYAPLLNRSLPGGEDLLTQLGGPLREALFTSSEYAALERSLPADSLVMLREASKKRLDDYLRNQPPTTVLATECSLSALFSCEGFDFSLVGKADRIDCRPLRHNSSGDAAEKGLFIIDYKSGRLPELRGSLWSDEAFWRSLDCLGPRLSPSGADPLDAVATRLPSVQLPLYMLVCSLAAEKNKLPPLRVGNALWVALGAEGEEQPLLPDKLSPDQAQQALQTYIPALLRALLRHLFQSEYFFPRPGPHCGWCSRKNSCTVSDGL